MQPFELTPQWRIGTADNNFTLERLTTPKKEDAQPTWKPVAFFARVEQVLDRWASDYIREHDGTLPEALMDAAEVLAFKAAELRDLMTVGAPND